MGSVPDSWGKYLTPGGITATLDVYGSDGALATHVDLIVDMEQGTVSAPQFKIPIGDTYRFIIIFNYALSASEAIPYAYADFTWLVDEFSEEVTFSENDIRYGYDAQDPLVSASLSEGKIPNLDLDGDGWTNWEELRDKVNPKSPTSVPIVPTVEVRGQQDGTATTATVVVTARDNAHVEDLRLVDPLCGVTVISDTLVNNVDGSVTRTLTLRLDLLSVSKNPRTLQGLADDGVTPAQNANHTLNFTVVGSASQPYFVFTDPEENGEVEGDAVFRGIACSRAEIDVGSVRFANQEISSAAWTGQRTPSGDFEMTSEAVNTALLPDGLVTLRVEVQDANGKTGQGSRVFSVVNDSQIKLVSPVGRRWVFGNEQIAVIVKNLPDSNLVVIEGNANFSLTSSTAGGAVGKLSVGNLAEGTVLPLTFKAVRSDGSEVVRKVDFTVRNRPQIQFVPEATKVFRNWSTNLFYKVVNVDPQQLFIEGEPTDGNGSRICEEDAVAKGITVCTGKYPVKVTSSESFEISAARLATSGESCVNCGAEASSGTVNAGVTLPKDIPEINAAIVGDDEPEAPARVKFPVESPTQHYRLTIKDLREGTEIFADELQSDETAILNALEPRRDYLATLQVLNGPGGNVLAEMFKEFTTGDLGLVGWWRFSSSNLGMDASGRNNHGAIIGAVSNNDKNNPALIFNDFGNRMDAGINGFSAQTGTLLLWFKPYFDPLIPINHGGNADVVSLVTLGTWNVNSIRLLYSMDDAYCRDSGIHLNSICAEIHGSPAPNEPVAAPWLQQVPSMDEFTFVALSWNQINDKTSLYSNINGSIVELPLSFPFSISPSAFHLGYSGTLPDSWPTWAFWYKGEFQDVSAYKETLSLEQIKEVCNRYYPGACP